METFDEWIKKNPDCKRFIPLIKAQDKRALEKRIRIAKDKIEKLKLILKTNGERE